MQTLKKIWDVLNGNKRRIALLGSLVASVTPAYTVVNVVGQAVFILFASVDALQLATNKLKKLKVQK